MSDDLPPWLFRSLLDRMAAGDRDAAGDLVARVKTAVHWQIHSQMAFLSFQDQDEALWETLQWLITSGQAALRRWDPSRGAPPLRWVRLTARGFISNRIRSIKRRSRLEVLPRDPDLPLHDRSSDEAPSQLELLQSEQERQRALEELDARLTPALRETFQRVYVDRMGSEDAALAMGCTAAAFRRRLADLRAVMKTVLEEMEEDAPARAPAPWPARASTAPGAGDPAPPGGRRGSAPPPERP